MSEQNFDVAVVGAGLAGILSARRILIENPTFRVVLVDREKSVGGRLRSSNATAGSWNTGLGLISEDLYNFWNETLKSDPDAPDLPSFGEHPLCRLGFVNASKIAETTTKDLLTAKGARVLGGLAASRDWITDQEFFQREGATGQDKVRPFSEIWPKSRKDASSAVMTQLNSLLGIPDLWHAAAQAVCQRANQLQGARMIERQTEAFEATIATPFFENRLSLRLGEQVISATFTGEKIWLLNTQLGTICAKNLVVAQPPWQALDWVPQKYWPPEILSLANRARPASLVVLSEKITNTSSELAELPDAIVIPVEEVHAIVCRDGTLSLQAVLEFERSMDHPEVVKSIRRLRRARKRLGQIYPWILTESEHIALLPVGWAQPYDSSEHRYIERLSEPWHRRNHLFFCGDSYGASYDGDANLLRSVVAVADQLQAPASK